MGLHGLRSSSRGIMGIAAIAIITISALVVPSFADDAVSMVEIGGLGGMSSSAWRMNDAGNVIGFSTTSDGRYAPYYAFPKGKMIEIVEDGLYYNVTALNNKGQVVGLLVDFNYNFTPYIWSRNSSFAISDMPDALYSLPTGINDKGTVVGWAMFDDAVPWVWDAVNGSKQLPLMPGDTAGEALGINRSGQIVGWTQSAGSPAHAVVWQPNGTITDLGQMGDNTYGDTINDNGVVAGEWYDGNQDKLFMWDRQNGMRDIGGIPNTEDVQICDNVTLTNLGVISGNTLMGFDLGGYVFYDTLHTFVWDSVNGFQAPDVLGGQYSPYDEIGNLNNLGQLCATNPKEISAVTSMGAQTSLGALGGDWSWAGSSNDLGAAIGGALSTTGYDQGIFWDPVNGTTSVGDLSGFGSTATGINAGGLVCGYSVALDGYTKAVLWTPATGMVSLGDLGGGDSMAAGVNDNGMVVGNSVTDSGDVHPFLFDPSTGMVDLGDLGLQYPWAETINNAGQITGYSYNDNGDSIAFLWDAVNGVQPLPSALGGPNDTARINNKGQVAGYSFAADYSTYHAYLYDPATGAADLGVLDGDFASDALGLSRFGQVVGLSYGDNGTRTFITSSGGLVDLSTLVDPAQKWTNLVAANVNQDGVIVGQGIHSGRFHGFVMTPRAHLAGMSLSTQRTVGGYSLTGSVTLDKPAPYDLYVQLQSDGGPSAAVPEVVMVPGGAASGSFQITTTFLPRTKTFHITATFRKQPFMRSLMVLGKAP